MLLVHPHLDRRIRVLARAGVPAAEIRRRLRPRAASLGVAVPSYTRVLDTVHAERWRGRTAPGGRVTVAGIFYGRLAAAELLPPVEARAHVHKHVPLLPRSRLRRVRLRRAA